MSKNTNSSAFRKIDVDQFNEDNFKDDDVPSQEATVGGVTEAEISNLLTKGNAAEALKVLLASAPIGSKNQADKVPIYKFLSRTLSTNESFKPKIARILKRNSQVP